MSKAIVNVGRPRSGKSTRTKKILDALVGQGRKKDIIVFDINNEYKQYYSEPFITFEEFSDIWYENLRNGRAKNKIFVFEEATLFFGTRSSNDFIKELLVRKRHENNIIVMNFHAISMIPKDIVALCDYVILHKTNDIEQHVKCRFTHPKFLQHWKNVNDSENEFEEKIVNLYSL